MNLGFEEQIHHVNTFSWQGDKFEMRPNQSQINYRRKRNILTQDKSIPFRKDETELGALILADNISIIDKYLTGTPRQPFASPRTLYVIALAQSNERRFTDISEKVMTKLWIEYGIADAILITPCYGSQQVRHNFFSFLYWERIE